MGMGMSLSMSHSMQLRHQLRLEPLVTMPQSNWSMIKAFEEDAAREFRFPLAAKRGKFEGFDVLDHVERLRRIDEANMVFRFAYTRGANPKTGRPSGYFKIPLLRDHHVEIKDIKKRVTRAEYERAVAIQECVGQMERIAHAIPYHSLLTEVQKHLRKKYTTDINNAVVVGVDRGGRLPAIIMGRALNHQQVFYLKVDQGGGQLDLDRLEEFAKDGIFQGKHVLFVDSTVDSGRQIEVLRRYFDDSGWQSKLGFQSWSIVGSNENGESLYKHLNINWGVDPDQTFEDNPTLMGVDYAPGSHCRVVEVPSETSEKIRKVILDVPDGFVYDLTDIDEQIAEYRRKLADHAKEEKSVAVSNRLISSINREIGVALDSKAWAKARSHASTMTIGDLSETGIARTENQITNLLIVGSGREPSEISDEVAEFIVKHLGEKYRFCAGTPHGNPGTVLRKATCYHPSDVRLYQPGNSTDNEEQSTTYFVGNDKQGMRKQMVSDAAAVLVLGGGEGTLNEVILSLVMGKLVFLVRGWGPVPAYVGSRMKFLKMSNLRMCASLVEAVQTLKGV